MPQCLRYPDRAHFIYELLQNAEDAQATTVEFEVRRDRLRFAHNGVRLFTSADVESITSIGTSTKKTSINKIGKFGVGFKAVFSYTRTPQIFSGDYNFQIEDLVCPIELPAIKRASADTIFIFPFDNPRKPPDSCFEEICSVLQTLDHTALLFLNHIREVKWTVHAQGSGFLRRAEMTGNLVEITRSAEPPLYFLRYQKALERHGDLRCGIAFSLAARSEKQRPLLSKSDLHDQFRLDSANGKLCIFFLGGHPKPAIDGHLKTGH